MGQHWPQSVTWTFLGTYIAMMGFISVVLALLISWFPTSYQSHEPIWNLGTYGLQLFLSIASWIILARIHRIRDFFSATGCTPVGWIPTMILPFAVYAVVMILLMGMSSISNIAGIELPGMRGQNIDPISLFGSDGIGLVLMFCIVTVIAPVVEEIGFRGILLAGLLRTFHPVLAIFISSVLFAAIHMQLDAMLLLFVQGMGMGWLYWYTKSIYPGMVYHIWNNLVALLVLFTTP